jgi:hypothetical protein
VVYDFETKRPSLVIFRIGGFLALSFFRIGDFLILATTTIMAKQPKGEE